MTRFREKKRFAFWLVFLFAYLLCSGRAGADPSRYPQFAQQRLPEGVTPEFIKLEEFVDEIINKKKPLIVDVRTREEYEEAHIKAAVSIPLGEIPLHLAEIPKDKLVVLY